MERERSKFQGVYLRRHSTRKHLGKPDICYDITYKTPSGRKIWEKIGWTSEGYTAQTAMQIRAERIRGMRHGEDVAPRKKRITFAEAWALYEKDWLCHVKTAKEDIRRYHAYLEASLAAKTLNEVGSLDIERLKKAMYAKGYSAQTIKHALGLVRRVYRKMTAWGMYSGNTPTNNVIMPKPDAARTRYLSESEARALLAELRRRSRFWHDAAILSLHTGMRFGEIISLRWEDVDFSAGIIHIRDAKSGSRAAHLSADAAAMLQERCIQPVGLIFPTKAGTQVIGRGGNTFSRVVENLEMNKGITDRRQRVVFHTLRHTFASWLAIKGIPLYVIGELLGHKTLEMTKRYSHLCPDAKQDAVTLIDTVLRGSGDAGAVHTSSSGKHPDTSK
jgi:integrase